MFTYNSVFKSDFQNVNFLFNRKWLPNFVGTNNYHMVSKVWSVSIPINFLFDVIVFFLIIMSVNNNDDGYLDQIYYHVWVNRYM